MGKQTESYKESEWERTLRKKMQWRRNTHPHPRSCRQKNKLSSSIMFLLKIKQQKKPAYYFAVYILNSRENTNSLSIWYFFDSFGYCSGGVSYTRVCNMYDNLQGCTTIYKELTRGFQNGRESMLIYENLRTYMKIYKRGRDYAQWETTTLVNK